GGGTTAHGPGRRAPPPPQPADRPPRSHSHTSQPPPISHRPARTNRITERATVMATVQRRPAANIQADRLEKSWPARRSVACRASSAYGSPTDVGPGSPPAPSPTSP